MSDQTVLETGLEHHRAGRFDEARAVYDAVLAKDPDNAEAHHLTGVLLLQTGDPEAALKALDRAIGLSGAVAKYHNNRGAALAALGRRDEAVAAIERAVEIDPEDSMNAVNLAVALTEAGRFDAALAAWQDIVAREPDNADAHSETAHLMLRTGDMRSAIYHYRKAVELAPGDPERHSHLCVALNSSADHSGAEILAEHRMWNERHAKPFVRSAPPPANDRDPDRRLRVGYVSADWRRHPVGYLTMPALSNHDSDSVEVVLYSNLGREDDLTQLFKHLGHRWCDISGETDEAVFERIRADGIDVLVDLTGHHNGNRLLVFARRAAPVQIEWESYSFSTGLDAMDAYIGDAVQTPPEIDGLYVEQVVRLPGSMAVIGYPDDAPDVVSPPVTTAGTVTFGVHASPASVTPAVIAAWSEIMAGFPGAKILPAGWGAAAVADLLVAAGFPESAVLRRDMSAPGATYRVWNDVDVALDPFPVSGNIETLEALWMGVPVVAMCGDRRISRRSAGHLTAIGLSDLVAGTTADYVRIASALAGDTARLGALRSGLRDAILASPLSDGVGQTRALEAIYRQLWQRWCADA